MRSKHIEYMKIAMSILLFVSVIIHPAPSSHSAFSWTPEKNIYIIQEKKGTVRHQKHTLQNQGPMAQDNENKYANDVFVMCPDRRPNTSR
jgi:hypothetical protein